MNNYICQGNKTNHIKEMVFRINISIPENNASVSQRVYLLTKMANHSKNTKHKCDVFLVPYLSHFLKKTSVLFQCTFLGRKNGWRLCNMSRMSRHGQVTWM